MKKKLINMTPHVINVLDDEDNIIQSIPSTGEIRLSMETEIIDNVNGIPLTATKFGKPKGLPDKEEGVLIIVSRMIKTAIDRDDLIVPAEIKRGKDGAIIGCHSFDIK